jgi:parvulin-like peptidyl-prolyl isomerase
MKLARLLLTITVITLFSILATAQESTLVDETVARVNNDVITKSALVKTEETYKAEIAQRFPDDPEKQKKEFEENRGLIIDALIEDKLIGQRATELGIDVEPEINRRILEVAKRTNPQWSLKEFEEALKSQGIDIEEIRKNIRNDEQRRIILFREVINPIYEKLSPTEKRDWYNSHIQLFKVPGSYKLSEVFITLEGRSEAEADALARQVVTEARGGRKFVDLVTAYSDPKRPTIKTNGELPVYKETEMADYLRKAVENLKSGDITEPLRTDKGFQIIHLDEVKLSTVRDFTEVEGDVAQELALERAGTQAKEYFKKLRKNAYIRIADAYKQAVTTP